MSLSRRERREMAKRMGFLGRTESYSAMTERFKRSIEVGEILHTRHLQEIRNHQIEAEAPEVSEEVKKDEEVNPFAFLGKR